MGKEKEKKMGIPWSFSKTKERKGIKDAHLVLRCCHGGRQKKDRSTLSMQVGISFRQGFKAASCWNQLFFIPSKRTQCLWAATGKRSPNVRHRHGSNAMNLGFKFFIYTYTIIGQVLFFFLCSFNIGDWMDRWLGWSRRLLMLQATSLIFLLDFVDFHLKQPSC